MTVSSRLKLMLECAWEGLPCADPLRPTQWEHGGDGLQYGPYAISYSERHGEAYVSRAPVPPYDGNALLAAIQALGT